MNSVELAKKIRIDAIKMISQAHASHIGSVFSVADIIAVLYNDVMNIDPKNPTDDDRDRFILGKGHAGASVYAVLAEMGFFPVSNLSCYYMDGSVLSGHVSSKNVPGVELSTGSLGHGSSVACGMAISAKIYHKKYKVYCVIGDGESEEGSVYEMALLANKYRLDNLTIIIDKNRIQAMGLCEDIVGTVDHESLWRSLGWEVFVVDGHNHDELRKAMLAKVSKPKMIIANTIKGKGVSFMENNNLWHYRPPLGDDYEKAIRELEGTQ